MLSLNKEEKVQDALGVLPIFAVPRTIGDFQVETRFTIYVKALTKDRALVRSTSMSIKELIDYLDRVYNNNYYSLNIKSLQSKTGIDLIKQINAQVDPSDFYTL